MDNVGLHLCDGGVGMVVGSVIEGNGVAGVALHRPSSKLTLMDFSLRGGSKYLAQVDEGCTLDARSCTMRSKGGACLAALGPGASASVTDSSLQGGRTATALLGQGACGSLGRCALEGSGGMGLRVEAGSAVDAVDCVIKGCVSACLVAMSRVQLQRCTLTGSLEGCGALVSDAGGSLAAMGCTLEANHGPNLQVMLGGSAELSGCMKGSIAGFGAVVAQAGSSLAASRCAFVANRVGNLNIKGGTSGRLLGCTLEGALLGAAVQVVFSRQQPLGHWLHAQQQPH